MTTDGGAGVGWRGWRCAPSSAPERPLTTQPHTVCPYCGRGPIAASADAWRCVHCGAPKWPRAERRRRR